MSMKKYIDADALAKEMCKAIRGQDEGLCVTRQKDRLQSCMRVIFEAPAVDVAEVVYGEWIPIIDEYSMYPDISFLLT